MGNILGGNQKPYYMNPPNTLSGDQQGFQNNLMNTNSADLGAAQGYENNLMGSTGLNSMNQGILNNIAATDQTSGAVNQANLGQQMAGLAGVNSGYITQSGQIQQNVAQQIASAGAQLGTAQGQEASQAAGQTMLGGALQNSYVGSPTLVTPPQSSKGGK